MKMKHLSPGDRVSPEWQRMKAHLEACLQEFREQNDGPMVPMNRDRLGGRIDFIKNLLALDSDPPPAQTENEKFKD